MHRRGFVTSLLAGGAVCAMAPAFGYEVTKSDAQWKKELSPAAYDVLRHEGTEAPFTSPLNNEHRKGVFACAGCALDLYASSTKFDSGTGWPSFWQPLPRAVGGMPLLTASRPELEPAAAPAPGRRVRPTWRLPWPARSCCHAPRRSP